MVVVFLTADETSISITGKSLEATLYVTVSEFELPAALAAFNLAVSNISALYAA